MMTFPGHNHHLFRWRGLGKKKSVDKMLVKNGDIDQWRKRVEVASEFAVSEVFSHKKPRSGTNSRAVPLQSSDQLKDHDDAYSEAQALLSDWLSSKLRLELEVEEEDDLMCCNERRSRAALASAQPAALNYSNFDDLYNCLAEEEEQSAVNSFLQDLMEQEVLDFGVMEELALDVGQKRKKFRDPIVTMEARHLQVRENRARQEAERQRQQGEREARRDAREEAKRREREEETTKRQQARRQEDMVQQEMVTLRRRMEERRGLEQLVRQRERERVEGQRAARSLQSAPPPLTNQRPQDRERLYKEQKLQTMVHMVNLKRLQRHFSGWYSVVLDRRLRLGKAKALCDWKRQLRAWRAWRGVVWAEHQQREVVRAEEDFRAENRQRQLAVESDRRRLLRRCLNEWQLWCRIEKEQRELLAQQQETRRKMAALINAASTGKLMSTETPTFQAIMAPVEATNPPEAPEKVGGALTNPHVINYNAKEDHHRSSTLAPNASAVPQHKTPVGAVAQPTQPWQVTRRHAAPTAAKLHGAQQRGEGGGFICLKSAVSPASRFENRHAVQQQIITQQRKLLKEQQEKIAQLKEEQSVKSLELEMEKTTQLTQLSMLRASRPKSHKGELPEQRASRVTGEPDSLCAPPRKAAARQTCPHAIITAMEVRARQRAERRMEIEELKRKKDEEKLAEMKAAEEQRQREEEEEKRKAGEKKREEKRQEREREEEKQRQLKRQQELMKLARQHHRRNLLLRRGLAPWKRLIQIKQANIQLAEHHRKVFILRRCTRGWQQSARESLSEKEAFVDQLHQHFLLRRSLSCWKRLKDWRMIQEERAKRFNRTRTLRRFLLALLDHVTQERLVEWDRQELAQEHNNRRVLRRCLLAWRQLPCLLRKERVKEQRREKLGQRVAEVLPDFGSYPL
ncbi:coiled-coil domain-containing protein 191 isoform X2 [Cyclopterus lumpus]|uniref:coiled-coil domain-containing protein 191 isoform X2 n=1 Tax=Cyclopterus lumpus TaxID=8103 RepID=UPI001486B323|nr:coiled-coil domain-containing protein 191 isoform X2 [Cyclopterus lumpus]